MHTCCPISYFLLPSVDLCDTAAILVTLLQPFYICSAMRLTLGYVHFTAIHYHYYYWCFMCLQRVHCAIGHTLAGVMTDASIMHTHPLYPFTTNVYLMPHDSHKSTKPLIITHSHCHRSLSVTSMHINSGHTMITSSP